jgi:hypothetical protein
VKVTSFVAQSIFFVRNFRIFVLHEIMLGSLNQEECDGREM